MMRGAVTLGKLAAITAWLFGNVTAEALTAHETAISACPGYIASNLQTRQDGIIGADLRLAGKACNVYGTDVNDLRLQVEYQTGKCPMWSGSQTHKDAQRIFRT
jgi:alpha-glucosidase